MKVPFRSTFEIAKKYEFYSDVFLYTSTICVILSFLLSNYKLIDFSNIFNTINSFFIVIYAILTFITEYVLLGASSYKRQDFIDNSFNTSYSEEKTESYFSNDNLEFGILKMGINCFENTLFTYHISKKMLIHILIKNSIISTIFLAITLSGNRSLVVMFLQLALPFLLLSKAFKHFLFVNKIERIYENFRKMFNNFSKDSKTVVPEILLNVIEYESILSWANILLDTKIYDNLNKDLSIKWNNLKKEYNLI